MVSTTFMIFYAVYAVAPVSSSAASFGELAMLYNVSRTVIVTCAESGVLWRMDGDTFRHGMDELSTKHLALAQGFFDNDPKFARVSPDDRKKLARLCSVQVFAHEAQIIRQGKVDDWMFIVLDGNGKVQISSGLPHEIMKPGSLLGSTGFMYTNHQVCSAKATTRVSGGLAWWSVAVVTVLSLLICVTLLLHHFNYLGWQGTVWGVGILFIVMSLFVGFCMLHSEFAAHRQLEKDSHCAVCRSGYILRGTNCEAWRCTTANGTGCKTCVGQAQRISNTTCATCNEGYHEDTGTCQAWRCTTANGTGCKTCVGQAQRISDTTCATCNEGYATCNEGYHEDIGTCQAWRCITATGTGCKTCVGQAQRISHATCATCNNGYHEDTGTCQAFKCTTGEGAGCKTCVPQANRTSDTTCAECNNDHRLEGERCKPVLHILEEEFKKQTQEFKKHTQEFKKAKRNISDLQVAHQQVAKLQEEKDKMEKAGRKEKESMAQELREASAQVAKIEAEMQEEREERERAQAELEKERSKLAQAEGAGKAEIEKVEEEKARIQKEKEDASKELEEERKKLRDLAKAVEPVLQSRRRMLWR